MTRIRSLLRTRGLFRLLDMAYSFPPDEIEDRIGQWRSTLSREPGPSDQAHADIDDHVRKEHSTFTWLLEAVLEWSGFAVEQAASGIAGSLGGVPGDR